MRHYILKRIDKRKQSLEFRRLISLLISLFGEVDLHDMVEWNAFYINKRINWHGVDIRYDIEIEKRGGSLSRYAYTSDDYGQNPLILRKKIEAWYDKGEEYEFSENV